MKDAFEFLQRIQEDPKFLKGAEKCASDDERRIFLHKEGFTFTAEELDAAIQALSSMKNRKRGRQAKDHRSSQRYDVFLKVNEVNGQPARHAVMLDISAWGAQVESLIPSPNNSDLELHFVPPGAKDGMRLLGKVVWSEHFPLSKRHNVGMQFYKSLNQLGKEGMFPLEKFKSAVQKRHEDIVSKEFLTIKEAAKKLGVHWYTVWRWTMENRINFKQVKAGCKILIPLSELLKFQTPMNNNSV
jgi:predicted ribosomally synthesized peptide with nif11-like leader